MDMKFAQKAYNLNNMKKYKDYYDINRIAVFCALK